MPNPINWERAVFNKWHFDDWISTGTRMKLDPYFTSYTTMIKNCNHLNIAAKAIKLLKET